MKYWYIHAGWKKNYFNEFYNNDIVAIGFGGIINKSWSKQEIQKAYEDRGIYDVKKTKHAVSQVDKFINTINVGDWVITYDRDNRQYHLGLITGNFEYMKLFIDDMPLTRKVKWLKQVCRDQLSQDVKNRLNRRQTITSIDGEIASQIFGKSFEDDYSHYEYDNLIEGNQKEVIRNIYEPNKNARMLCVKHYGAKCSVCNLDFGQRYPGIGKGYMHVHHLKKISESISEYKIDPVSDLRPVCPNCHAMIHRKDPAFTIEEIKNIIQDA